MAPNQRKYPRRTLMHHARIVGLDGSWGHNCCVVDVSASGAQLSTPQPVELPSDFVLSLSASGKAVRKCHLVWTKGNLFGVTFDVVRK